MATPYKFRLEASKINRERVDAFEVALMELADRHDFPVASFQILEIRDADQYPVITVEFLQHPRSEQ